MGHVIDQKKIPKKIQNTLKTYFENGQFLKNRAPEILPPENSQSGHPYYSQIQSAIF